MRVIRHPILKPRQTRHVTIYYNGSPLEAQDGEPVAAALLAAGIRVFRTTHRFGRPRGLFCGIGRCTDCMAIVDGAPNVRTCVTAVREGMKVEFQAGLGNWPGEVALPAQSRKENLAGWDS